MPDGIFSPLERSLLKNSTTINICSNPKRSENFYSEYLNYKADLFNRNNFLRKYNHSSFQINITDDANCSQNGLNLVNLLENFSNNISNDIQFLNKDDYQKDFSFSYKGSPKDIYIHRDADIESLVFINAEDGPVIIDKGTSVSSFSYLKGPLYIGPKSNIDHATIETSRIGAVNRLGGEIADSFFGNFSNKHHEGFVGHSIIGDWVNLGALTTTSDLKNNYSKIHLEFDHKPIETGTIKFGSIIGDFVKTAIGTMLNTGTILSPGSLLFEGFQPRKYFPPFFWGGAEEKIYDQNKFYIDTEKIMQRRNQSLHSFEKNQLKQLFAQRYLT